MFLMISCAECF